MLAMSPERRVRQKPKQRMRGDVNPETALEYFQISVNILEARYLAWTSSQTANTYVVVMLGKEKYKTNIRKTIEGSRYKEFLLFEWYTSLKDLQQAAMWLAVMEPRCCAPPRLLGETNIDLGVIWAQTNHEVLHKWTQLRLPRDPHAGAVGYLNVDIAILRKGHIQVMPVMFPSGNTAHDYVEGGSVQQTANYLITIYEAFGIFDQQWQAVNGQLPRTFVKVSFCGHTARTGIQYGSINPSYCERIRITEVFPSACQIVRIEVCGTLEKALATVELNLAHISYEGEHGFVPTFGPSLLHMYGGRDGDYIGSPTEDCPFYKGAILISLKTLIPNEQIDFPSTAIEPVHPIIVEKLWRWEDICVFCPILEVSMLDPQFASKFCGVAITMGEININNNNNGEKRKLHYTGSIDIATADNGYGHLNFNNAFPLLQLAAHLPDFRFRIYRNNVVRKIAHDLNNALLDVDDRITKYDYENTCDLLDRIKEAIDRATENLTKYFDIHFSTTTPDLGDSEQYFTDLDHKQLILQKVELETIYRQLKEKTLCDSSDGAMNFAKSTERCFITKKYAKKLLAETKMIAQKLDNLVFKGPEGWPDVVLWLLNDGSRFASHRISTSEIIFSEIPEQSGKSCGSIQTLFMKPLRCTKHTDLASGCSCIAGKVEFLMWMGTYSERSALHSLMPAAFCIKVKDQDMCVKANLMLVECFVYICRARITPSDNFQVPPSPFVRVNVFNNIKESKVAIKTCSPVWSQILSVRCMTRSSTDRLNSDPPMVLVELYDHKLCGVELIGRLELQAIPCETPNSVYAPKLKWRNLIKNRECIGEILISAKVQQIPETLIKTTNYGSINDNNYEAINMQTKYLEPDNDGIGANMPAQLIPKYSTYKVDVYWWGLRDLKSAQKPCAILKVDDLIIKSDVIAENYVNSNFPKGRVSQTFESNFDSIYYSPLMRIKLYDSSTYGRKIYLATTIVKNTSKFLVDWLPKYDRELSLSSAVFTSSEFLKVSEKLFIKKSRISCDMNIKSRMMVSNSMLDQKTRVSWKRLFCSKEPDEEEYVLLPMYVKEKKPFDIMGKKAENEFYDWWSRFVCAQKRNSHNNNEIKTKIKVYDSELENQPEFNKFKDWCKTVKLYNIEKTVMPQKDSVLPCGYLKAGIAIYRWPPSSDTVAVNDAGVALHRGYFDDLPSNEPLKFLIRVYIVRALNLTPKDSGGKCDPYFYIMCGTKTAGDRDMFVNNSTNPVFGRMHEIRCKLPEDYLLTISLYDHNKMTDDGLIGSTSIDLENRIFSKHRALVGLSSTYNVTGIGKWRDIKKPSDILEEMTIKNHLQLPSFPDGNTVIVNGIEYMDAEKNNNTYVSASERKENICLDLLHSWHTLPVCGYHLVPEHVETRSLFNPDTPGLEQGQIQMWIDIFPLKTGLFVPMPVDITPPKIEDYELRVIVWRVHCVKIQGVPVNKALDLYVKAWIGNVEDINYTDIRYRSVNGDATFNWRMKFNFQYQPSGKKLIIKERGPFTEVEEYLPPILVVQVADSDSDIRVASIDNSLATLSLDLNAVPRGSKHLQQRNNLLNADSTSTIDMFSVKSIRSWWPLKSVDQKTESLKFAGMIDLELHLIPKHKTTVIPAGLGRNPPFPLPEPNRAEAYYSSEMKSSIRDSITNRNKKVYAYMTPALLLGLLLFGAICYWTLPNYMFGYLVF